MVGHSFLIIKSKIRPADMSYLRAEFVKAIGKGYRIRAPSSQE